MANLLATRNGRDDTCSVVSAYLLPLLRLLPSLPLPRRSGAGAVRMASSDLRRVVDSTLFRWWLENLQTDKGVLAYGKLSLQRVQFRWGINPSMAYLNLRHAMCAGESTCSGGVWDFSSSKPTSSTKKPKPDLIRTSQKAKILLLIDTSY